MAETYVFGLKSCVDGDVAMAINNLRFAIDRANMLGAGTSLLPNIQLLRDAVDVVSEQHVALSRAIEASEEYRHQYDQSYLDQTTPRPSGNNKMQPLQPRGPMQPLKPQGPASMLLHPEYTTLDRRI